MNTEDIKKMDMQQTFDFIVEHMAKQRRRAMAPATGCAYRGPGGTSCAVGCMLPDNVAVKLDSMLISGGTSFIRNDDVYEAAKDYLPVLPQNFFVDMQTAHDGPGEEYEQSRTVEGVQSRLRDRANTWGLNADKVALITEWS